jgi:microsomal dipeptidase-like Zn-dependent dipeptidase
MLLDLHAHYPMHLLPQERRRTHEQLKRWRRARIRARIVRTLSRFINYQGPGDSPGVTLELMQAGDVGVIFSALYQPFDEIDLDKRYGARPDGGYFQDLIDQLEDVEADIAAQRSAGAAVAIAHSPQELAAALDGGRQVLIHSVEGGFHLGGEEREIAENVHTLAERGVVCITVAHLFWRGVATNSPALPFMSDGLYDLVFRQPKREGLSALGVAAVQAMAEHGILIDITHMSDRAITDTFDLLDERRCDPPIPVIATHMACRLGKLRYNLSDETIARVGKTGGLLGLIACEHYISDGNAKPASFEDSFALLCKHIDHICEVTGSTDHVAFGSDLDGYIKPALPGIEHLGRMRTLQEALTAKYGAEKASKFSSGNALRVLGTAWQRAAPPRAAPPGATAA